MVYCGDSCQNEKDINQLSIKYDIEDEGGMEGQ